MVTTCPGFRPTAIVFNNVAALSGMASMTDAEKATTAAAAGLFRAETSNSDLRWMRRWNRRQIHAEVIDGSDCPAMLML